MICLSFDTDHMSDNAMQEFLSSFALPGQCTFFCHRRFPALEATPHEIAAHPFITDLRTWTTSYDQLVAEFSSPPRGARAHSCAYSHVIGETLHMRGVSYLSMQSWGGAGYPLPYRHPWGLWELPIFYMDNMDFSLERFWPGLGHAPFGTAIIESALRPEGTFVFDFHPLHILLNTRSFADYQAVREAVVRRGEPPAAHAFPGRGTATFFTELLDAMRAERLVSTSCAAAIDALSA